jgi:plastocyanin
VFKRIFPIAVLSIGLALSLALAGEGQAKTPVRLTGTVGPGFTITLTRAGTTVKSLKRGTYVIKVSDLATDHNFHLTGPGVNRTTSVGGTGTTTWTVTLRKGVYTYVCDPHATTMRGTFTVT